MRDECKNICRNHCSRISATSLYSTETVMTGESCISKCFSVLDMKAVVGEAVSIKKEFKTENRMKKLKNIVGYVASALRLKMTMREKVCCELI